MKNNSTKNKPVKNRLIKIQPKYFEREVRYVIYPKILLTGKWLQHIGFYAGNKVMVDVQEQNKIIITIVEPVVVPEEEDIEPEFDEQLPYEEPVTENRQTFFL